MSISTSTTWPAFGSKDTCKYEGIDVQCGPRGLKGAADNLYHNNRDGTFTDVSKKSGVSDPEQRYGLTAVWSDFDNDGKLDLFVANDAGPNYLYKGDGAGRFTDAGFTSGIAYNENGQAQANMGVALGDYLHTGRFSVFISHFDNEYAALYRNEGGMNFSEVSVASGVAKAIARLRRLGRCVRRFRQPRLARHLPGQRPRLSAGRLCAHRAPIPRTDGAA